MSSLGGQNRDIGTTSQMLLPMVNLHVITSVMPASIAEVRNYLGKPEKFRPFYCNCISCVFNCDDLLYIQFFIPHFKFMKFILFYSSFQRIAMLWILPATNQQIRLLWNVVVESREWFYFMQQICMLFIYQPKANLICDKWRKVCKLYVYFISVLETL